MKLFRPFCSFLDHTFVVQQKKIVDVYTVLSDDWVDDKETSGICRNYQDFSFHIEYHFVLHLSTLRNHLQTSFCILFNYS